MNIGNMEREGATSAALRAVERDWNQRLVFRQMQSEKRLTGVPLMALVANTMVSQSGYGQTHSYQNACF